MSVKLADVKHTDRSTLLSARHATHLRQRKDKQELVNEESTYRTTKSCSLVCSHLRHAIVDKLTNEGHYAQQIKVFFFFLSHTSRALPYLSIVELL